MPAPRRSGARSYVMMILFAPALGKPVSFPGCDIRCSHILDEFARSKFQDGAIQPVPSPVGNSWPLIESAIGEAYDWPRAKPAIGPAVAPNFMSYSLKPGQPPSPELASPAVLVMDGAGMVVEWTPQAEEIFGWPREEAVRQKLSARIIPSAIAPPTKPASSVFLPEAPARCSTER